jgi:UDP-N-acetyl-D-galactosamine dehydrogenase
MNILSNFSKDSNLMSKLRRKEASLVIMGLNDESLRLAMEWSQHFSVVLYDECEEYIQLLQSNIDPFGIWDQAAFDGTLRFTSSIDELGAADAFVIAPDTISGQDEIAKLSWTKRITRTVAGLLTANSCVIFENNLKLKWIEAICLPILEKISGLEIGVDFNIGFMPSLEARLEHESINSEVLVESNKNIVDAVQRLYSYIPLKGELESREALKSFLTREWSTLAQKMKHNIPGVVMNAQPPLNMPSSGSWAV